MSGETTTGRPLLSIVVVVFQMEREAARTLHSLSGAYQRGVSEDAYEVVVVDNGSSLPLDADHVGRCGRNFHHSYLEGAPASPAHAINVGVARSRGEFVALMVDGARIASPGLVRYALSAVSLYPKPIVAALGFHLGPDVQKRSVLAGYDQAVEDELLRQIDWPTDGYRLFEIATLAGSSWGGWVGPINESSFLVLRRETFDELGGYDERFDLPGGGLVNLDTYRRACDLPGTRLVRILGEGTFHQFHGGVMTNAPEPEHDRVTPALQAQYERIRGKPWETPEKEADFLGHLPREALRFLRALDPIAA